MIILSQDKDVIINFDNIENIRVCSYENAVAIQATGTSCNSEEFYMLGYYKTEERAKEVLQEIIDKYKYSYTITYNDLSTPTLVPRPLVYEMPKE